MSLESFDQSGVELKEGKDDEGNFVLWNQADIDTLKAANRHRVRELLYDFLYK